MNSKAKISNQCWIFSFDFVCFVYLLVTIWVLHNNQCRKEKDRKKSGAEAAKPEETAKLGHDEPVSRN